MDPILQSPDNGVAPSDKIEMSIQRNGVIQADVIVPQDSIVNEDRGKGDDPSLLPPKEEPRTVRHSAGQFAEVCLREFFKFKFRSLKRLPIERINFINKRRNICNYFPMNSFSFFSLPEFFAEIFPYRIAYSFCEIFFEIFEV